VSEIASHLNCASNTVRQTFYRWLSQGIEGLFDAPRSGRAKKWNSEALKFLETCLSQEQRTYNSRQLSEKLKQERQVKLSAERIRKIFKKKIGDGKERKKV
jgi:transposase